MGHHSMKGKQFPKREKKVLLPEEYQFTGRSQQLYLKLKKEYERCLQEEELDRENYKDRMAHYVILGVCDYATKEPEALKNKIIETIGGIEDNIFTRYLKENDGVNTENPRIMIGSYSILLMTEFKKEYDPPALVQLCWNRGWKKKVKVPEFTNRVAIAIRHLFQKNEIEESLTNEIIKIQPEPIKAKWQIEREKKIKLMEERRANGWKKLPTPVVPKKIHPNIGYWCDKSIELAKAALVLGYKVIGKESIPQYHGKETMIRSYMRSLGLHSVIPFEDAFPELQSGEEVSVEEIINSRPL